MSRKNSCKVMAVLFYIAAAVSFSAALQHDEFEIMKIPELIEASAANDGKRVLIEGELIGDFMRRGDYGWLSLSSGGMAIAVWLRKGEEPPNMMLGRYGIAGDMVQVKGVMHRTCTEHGGDLDIHAESIALIKKGERIAHPVNASRLTVAILLGTGGIGAFAIWRRREATAERMKKR